MTQRDTKLKENLRELAAKFFSRESNRTSLITITGVEILNRGSKARILMTVMPENQQHAALDFAHRQLSEFKEYVMQESRIGRVPFFEIALDIGEKNRQRIDEIEKSI